MTTIDPPWTLLSPVEIAFAAGARSAMAEYAPARGTFLLVATPGGRKRIERDAAFASLIQMPNAMWVDDIVVTPDIQALESRIEQVRGCGVTAIFAIGGGSVIDAAKAISIGASTSPGVTLRQLVEEPGLADAQAPLPLFVAPTTAGTGSEVTPFATVWDHAQKKKLSLATARLLPHRAFLDPELTLDLPEDVTVNSGLDAICQAAEAIWNRNATAHSDQVAIAALAHGLDALPRLITTARDVRARHAMMAASLFAGLAISHTRTALCHSISYPLTAHFGMPHGLACAFTMGAVFRCNLNHDESRFHQAAAQLAGGNPESLYARMAQTVASLDVRGRARAYIPSMEALLALADAMIHSGRADNNLAPVTPGVVEHILRVSYGQS